MAALGATTHLALLAVRARAGEPSVLAKVRRYAAVIGASYGLAFLTGLLLYPTYRWNVRALFLDQQAKGISDLFELKEELAVLALPACLLLWVVGRKVDTSGRDPLALPATIASSWILWVVTATAVVAGLWVTSVKGV
jgi:hypothetical protein